jgi:hypothetical protein
MQQMDYIRPGAWPNQICDGGDVGHNLTRSQMTRRASVAPEAAGAGSAKLATIRGRSSSAPGV